MIATTTVIQVSIVVGFLMPLIGFILLKAYFKNKVKVHLVHPDGRVTGHFKRPSKDGFLQLEERAYVFNRHFVGHIRIPLIGEVVPFLSYLVGEAVPQNLHERGPVPEGAEGIGSTRLHHFMEDKDIEQLGRGLNSKVTPKELMTAIVGVGICLGVVVAAGFWYVLQNLNAV